LPEKYVYLEDLYRKTKEEIKELRLHLGARKKEEERLIIELAKLNLKLNEYEKKMD